MATSFLSLVKRFAREENGASFVEYAMLVGIVAIAAATFLAAFRGQIAEAFDAIGAALIGATPPA